VLILPVIYLLPCSTNWDLVAVVGMIFLMGHKERKPAMAHTARPDAEDATLIVAVMPQLQIPG
jgi:hypothetical protein